MPAANMKTMMTASIMGLPNDSMLLSRVENPPVAMVVNV